MLCTFSIALKSIWFDMASKMSGRVPARLYEESGVPMIQMYFHKRGLSKERISVIMANRNSVEKQSYYSIAEKIENVEPVNEVLKIKEVPSVLMAESYVEGGNLYLSFRFHSSLLDQVNRVMDTVSRSNTSSRVVFLGASPGLIFLLNKISSNTPLSVIRIRMPIPNLEDVPQGLTGINLIGEGEARSIDMDKSRVILYSSMKVEWASTISSKDNVFEMMLVEPFNLALAVKAHESRVPLMASFGTTVDSLVEITVFLPLSEVEDYLGAYYSLVVEMQG